MRILLAHNSLYFPSHGGGDKSNRLLMAALRARGHEVEVLARVAEFSAASHATLIRELQSRGLAPWSAHESVRFSLDGVEIHVFTHGRSFRRWTATRMQEFHPDVILTSTDDPAHLMLHEALRVERARVIYMVRALIALPFGPASPFRSESKTAALRQADGSVAVSEYVAAYARRWGHLDTAYVPISLPDRTEFPLLGSFDNRFVTLVNPCAGKGLAIFLALAAHFPGVSFAAVPTWGTTEADLAAMRQLPNISILPPTDDIDSIFRQTRIVLVPSLWAEARSRVILEAMARGIPVLASNVGGLAEAMLGMDYLLPVNPIEQYQAAVDELMVPVVEVPPQDPAPWVEALGRLVNDRVHYEDLARRSRETAAAYARGLTVEPLEACMERVLRAPRRRHAAPHPAGTLSAERRRLLALRVKQKQQSESETE